MPTWLLTSIFAGIRAVYSALIEAFVCWGLCDLVLSCSTLEFRISYWIWFGFWYITGFIVAFIQYWRILKDC